jgi:hypothetical protein
LRATKQYEKSENIWENSQVPGGRKSFAFGKAHLSAQRPALQPEKKKLRKERML